MDYKKVNDYEVMYMIKEGNDDARDLMLKKYEPLVRKIAGNYFSFSKDSGVEYEELVQEGLVGLYKAILCYKEESNVLFFTFAQVCIKRSIQNCCKSTRKTREDVLNNSLHFKDYNLLECFPNYHTDFEPERFLFHDYTEENFVNCKNLLTSGQSIVFELKVNGFSYKEISHLLGISINAVDNRLCQVRRILKRKKMFFR